MEKLTFTLTKNIDCDHCLLDNETEQVFYADELIHSLDSFLNSIGYNITDYGDKITITFNDAVKECD